MSRRRLKPPPVSPLVEHMLIGGLISGIVLVLFLVMRNLEG